MAFNDVSISSKYLDEADKLCCAVMAAHLQGLADNLFVSRVGNDLTVKEYKRLLEMEIDQRVEFCDLVENILKKIAESEERKNEELREKLRTSEILKKYSENMNFIQEQYEKTKTQILSGDFSMLKEEVRDEEETGKNTEMETISPLIPSYQQTVVERPVFTSHFAKKIEAEFLGNFEKNVLGPMNGLSFREADAPHSIKKSENSKLELSSFSSACGIGDTAFLGNLSDINHVSGRNSLVSSLDGSICVNESAQCSKQRGLCYYSPIVSKTPPPAPNFDDSDDFNDQNKIPDYSGAVGRLSEKNQPMEFRTPLASKADYSYVDTYVERPKFSSTFGQQFND
ncbi:unnamed protein product [Auanema sp. JU1783]|nr:unnamed protein product [Auanema sp. JU1783]